MILACSSGFDKDRDIWILPQPIWYSLKCRQSNKDTSVSTLLNIFSALMIITMLFLSYILHCLVIIMMKRTVVFNKQETVSVA